MCWHCTGRRDTSRRFVAYPRFTDNTDGTMTDHLTGLIWTKDANIFGGTSTWYQAMDYVSGMNGGIYQNYGHTDWRLPNVNDLESVRNDNESNPANWLDGQGFMNLQSNSYWTSTTCKYATDYSMVVYMYNSSLDYGYMITTINKSLNSNYIWPVRGGQCNGTNFSVICLQKTGQIISYYPNDDGASRKVLHGHIHVLLITTTVL